MRLRHDSGGSGATGDVDGELYVAESTPVPDLPGLFSKKIILGAEQTGLLTSKGNVIYELSVGPNNVGMSILGWGASNREAVILHNRPFRLQMHHSGLLSKGYESLDASIHVTASVSAPRLFYNTVVRGRERTSSSQVASAVAAGLDDLIQVKVTEHDGQELRHDQATRERLIGELEPHLKGLLEERGLHLESVDLVAFDNPAEGGELLDELTSIEQLIGRKVKPGREDVQRLLTRLTSTGLATSEMTERAQLLFDGGTPDAFFSVMKDIGSSSRRRLEAQVADRSEQLSQKVNPQDSGLFRVGAMAKEKGMTLIGPACAIAGLVFKFVASATMGWIGLGAGLVAGVLFIIGYFVVRALRLLGLRNRDEIVIRLDRWAKRNSMATDDLIRRQMGREFSNSLVDVKDAKLVAFRQEKKEIADSLNDLENKMDLLRTEVESAPAASTIVSAKGFPVQRISRMVNFEEELLRQARNLSIRSQTAKESLNADDVEALRVGLDQFQRTFSKRLGLLEGFKEL